MAKRKSKAPATGGVRGAAAPVPSKVGDLAEDLGRLLGSAERRAASWLDRRQTVATQLTAIRDKASALLTQLGWGSPESTTGHKRGAKGSMKRAPGRKKRVVSAESSAKKTAARTKRPRKRRKG